MSNKQTIIDNNARIEAITNRLNNSTFADVRDTTATAGDVASGKIFYDKDGVRTEGAGTISSGKDMLQARVDSNNSCYYLFYWYNGDNIDFIKDLDTSNVTIMNSMFQNCSKLTAIPLLDTSKVTDTGSMFKECIKLTTIPLLDTSNVTNAREMFYNCQALTEIPQLDTSNVTNMYGIFQNCRAIITLPELNTSKNTRMDYMFNGCGKLTTIPLLDMINATNVSSVFNGCTNLTNLTLKNIKLELQIGSGTSWGHLLTLDSLINTIKELWDYSSGTSTRKLTMGTANLEKIANTYVKLIDVTDEMIAQDALIANKKPCVVCESTDEGAMTITEYALLKKWSLA